MNNFVLTLTEEDMTILDKVLVNGVYKEVAPLIQKINVQITEQMSKPCDEKVESE